MRLTLYWRGYDLIDIEAHVWKRRDDKDDESCPESCCITAESELAFGFGQGR